MSWQRRYDELVGQFADGMDYGGDAGDAGSGAPAATAVAANIAAEAIARDRAAAATGMTAAQPAVAVVQCFGRQTVWCVACPLRRLHRPALTLPSPPHLALHPPTPSRPHPAPPPSRGRCAVAILRRVLREARWPLHSDSADAEASLAALAVATVSAAASGGRGDGHHGAPAQPQQQRQQRQSGPTSMVLE